MEAQKNTRGAGALETLLIIVIIGLIGFVGYKVYSTKNNTDKIDQNTTSVAQKIAPTTTPIVPSINSTDDLDKATSVLNQNDKSTDEDTDVSQLDAQLSTF